MLIVYSTLVYSQSASSNEEIWKGRGRDHERRTRLDSGQECLQHRQMDPSSPGTAQGPGRVAQYIVVDCSQTCVCDMKTKI